MDDIIPKVVVFHHNKVLLSKKSIFWDKSFFEGGNQDVIRTINLGAIHLIELSSSEHDSDFLLSDSQWIPVKEALHIIDPQEFSVYTRAISLMQWDKYHQFCGSCAKQTIWVGDGFERQCQPCQMHYYPRISPAVIVLIRRHNEILMARSPHFPPGVYALVAGFVEAGETLEQTVHREVLEEVGIKIKNLTYFGSQPWPFPDSLMIGFTAEYESGDIVIDNSELEDAGWYPYDQLPGLPSFSMSIGFEMLRKFKPM